MFELYEKARELPHREQTSAKLILTSVNRGFAHLCKRADITHSAGERRSYHPSKSVSPRSPGYQESVAPVRQDNDSPINERILSLVTALSERVKHLETKLDGVEPRSLSAPTGGVNDVSEPSQPPKRAKTSQPEISQVILNLRDDELAPAETESNSGQNSSDEVEEAATVLEFLAWGRLKDNNITGGLRDPSGVHGATVYPEKDVIQTTQAWGSSPSSASASHMTLETLQISQIQGMLPERQQVMLLFENHAEWLLFMHCSFHVQTFRGELEQFYANDKGIISRTSSGIQWAALLFAILCGSMACAKPTQVSGWGYNRGE